MPRRLLFIALGLCLVTARPSAAEPGVSDACRNARIVRALHEIETGGDSDDIAQLLRFVCNPDHAKPAGSVFYPNGQYAFVGPEFSDRGSWKYPNGQYAYAGQGFSDRESWKYPNGQYAYAGPGFSDRESWRYPNGQYAFAGPGFSDRDSWKYPNGQYAYAGPGFSDRGSWKFPNGQYAFAGPGFSDRESWKFPNGKYAYAGPGFSDRGTWYYPNGVIYSTSVPANTDGRTLVRVVETFKNLSFHSPVKGFRSLPEPLQILIRLTWVQSVLSE